MAVADRSETERNHERNGMHPARAPLAGSAPLVGAALALESLRQRWRLIEAENRGPKHRPLSKSGRLYSRLRKRADELMNNVSE
jgi:hypothetical protein